MLIRHNSFTGHMKVQKLFNRTKKFKFIAHEKDIYRPDGSTFAQPDLVFLYKDRPVYVEVKTNRKGNRSLLQKQCIKLANMQGKKSVLGFIYDTVGRTISLQFGYGYQVHEIKSLVNIN